MIGQAGAVSSRMAIYAFEGPNELYVHPSLEAAESHFEAIDVENEESVFFGSDGTLIQSSVRHGRVLLSPTDEQRAEELRGRLRAYLAQPGVALDPGLADDTVALACLLLDREPASAQSGWLGRLLNRRSD
jgi:hypothetical protein